MAMPKNLVLVRHGESEGNIATKAAENGDTRWYTDSFITTPGHQWRLTARGRAQAAASGAWIRTNVADRFDRYYVSPFVRTKETADHLDLPGSRWALNRALRERDWGDIGTLPRNEFESRPEYALNAWLKAHDPLYWRPPGGESIAGVAEDRIRNVLSTLHRECEGQDVIAVAHGEVMWAFRLVLERLDDARFVELDADQGEKIHNCAVLHYTRVDPVSGDLEPRLTWLRRAHPIIEPDGTSTMHVEPWLRIPFRTYSSDELLAQVAAVPTLFAEHQR